MSAADDLREAAAAERARYSRPFVEGPRPGSRTLPRTDELLTIVDRRRALIAALNEIDPEPAPLQVVRESA